jgi:stalled ribosome alternative rescue factor ArfA
MDFEKFLIAYISIGLAAYAMLLFITWSPKSYTRQYAKRVRVPYLVVCLLIIPTWPAVPSALFREHLRRKRKGATAYKIQDVNPHRRTEYHYNDTNKTKYINRGQDHE